eukprot:SAG31_NODE_249_length_19118_cov_47.456195_18_plen_330_part_00
MSEAGGTAISSQGLYVETLITQSFTATVGVLSMNSEVQTLLGHITRVTDMLLVISDLKHVPAKDHGAHFGFDNARVHAPDGSLVVSDLTVQLSNTAGTRQTLMVVAPTGAGKSCLFRSLAGLSAPAQGRVRSPPRAAFVGQRPLATTTQLSMLEFILYPQMVADMTETEVKRAKLELAEILDSLGAYCVTREGWAARRYWAEHLSLGEQQCLGCARMFYHLRCRGSNGACQRWGIMDCCTTAMSDEMAKRVFAYAAQQGISILHFARQDESNIVEVAEASDFNAILTLGGDHTNGGWHLQQRDYKAAFHASRSSGHHVPSGKTFGNLKT